MPDRSFWNQRYLDKNTGWDLGQAAPPFVHLVDSGQLIIGAKVLIPGAGRSHEGIYLARTGFDVTCVDFAPAAVQEARESAHLAKVEMKVLEADFFDLNPILHGQFDYLIEHTCFCAIDPDMRTSYVEKAYQMLRPGGMLVGLFYAHNREGGPPWKTTEEEVRSLFEKRFDLVELALSDYSIDSRKGEELFGRLKRKSG
ncbi:MAG: methyltransferase domain-containing protein [Leptospirales bacterium]